ncbi:hypothetical protein HPCPY1313_0856 [Helicobacter pylori CPY1313]|nr:hypothetical protein HPCPY1313_0856 [Helicobacter pylori CPY1313]
MDISYPKKTILASFSLNIAPNSYAPTSCTLKGGVFRASGIKR